MSKYTTIAKIRLQGWRNMQSVADSAGSQLLEVLVEGDSRSIHSVSIEKIRSDVRDNDMADLSTLSCI